MADLTHFNEQGRAKMVDVGEKPISQRVAVAAGRVLVNEKTFSLIRSGGMKKGDVLTVAQIAASASVSKSECLRCFRASIGATPIQYLRQFRVQKAAELLVGTRLKISDVGAQCGFQEPSYFIKTFRELMGRTPAAYRAQKRASPK